MQSGHSEVAMILIDKGADLSIKDMVIKITHTHILHTLSTGNLHQSCTLLLFYSSSTPEFFDLLYPQQNKLPADIAKENGLTAVVAAIKIRQEV